MEGECLLAGQLGNCDRYLPAVFSITEKGTDYLYRVICSPSLIR